MKIIFAIFFVICFIGCTSKNYKNKYDNNNIYQKVAQADSFTNLFSLKKIINLETTDSSLIGQIFDIIYLPEKNKIIILDKTIAKGVFVFNCAGKFLYKIGKNGDGPREYRVPTAIAYENNKIVISSWTGTILFYTLDNEFINQISLPANGYKFSVTAMLLWKNDLYIYNNNSGLNTGLDGKKHVVFRLNNCSIFEDNWGEPEETRDFERTDIVRLNNKIIYSNIFDGNVYQIENNNFSVFGSLDKLLDIDDYPDVRSLMRHKNEIDFVNMVGVIKDSLVVLRRVGNVSIMDGSGNVIQDKLPSGKLKRPDGFGELADRRGYHFFNNGYILSLIGLDDITENHVPNPSLLIYEIN